MLRHEVMASICQAQGLLDASGRDSLLAEYLQAVRDEPPTAAFLTFEAWGFSIGLFDPSSLAVLTRAFNELRFRCTSCGQECTGARFTERLELACPSCQADAMEQLPASAGPPPGPSNLPPLPGIGSAPAPAPGAAKRGESASTLAQLGIGVPKSPAPAPAPGPGPDSSGSASDIENEIAAFDAEGVGETIYADGSASDVLPELPALRQSLEEQKESSRQIPTAAESGPEGDGFDGFDSDDDRDLVNINTPDTRDIKPGDGVPPELAALRASIEHERRADSSRSDPGTMIDLSADSAAGELGSLVRSEDEFRLRYERARGLLMGFQYEDAIREFEALLTFNPDDAGAKEHYAKAKEGYDQIIDLEAAATDARERGNFDEAESHLLKLQELMPLGFTTEVLQEVRTERDAARSIIDQVDAVIRTGDFDAAEATLDRLVAEHPSFVALAHMRKQFIETRPDREAVARAMASGELSSAKSAVERLRKAMPQSGQYRAIWAQIEQSEQMARHDKLIDDAHGELRRGNPAGALALANKARDIIPGSQKARELGDAVDRRDRTRRLKFNALIALAVLAVLAVGVFMVMGQLQAGALASAQDHTEARDRVEALRAYLASYPGDSDAEALLESAEAEWRKQEYERATATTNLPQRVRLLEEFLGNWPGDAQATALLETSRGELREADRLKRERLALASILANLANDPVKRLEALRKFAADHPDNSTVGLEIEKARADAVRVQFESRLDRDDPRQRFVLARTTLGEVQDEVSEAWDAFRTEVKQERDSARDILIRQTRDDGEAMLDRAAARALLQRVASLEELDETFRDRFADEQASARTIIAEDDRADQLTAGADAITDWFEAGDYRLQLEQFLAGIRSARRREAVGKRLQPAITRMATLEASAPPKLRGFSFLRQQEFVCGERRASVNIYRHDRIAELLGLPDPPASYRDRLDPDGKWTRPDVEFVLLPPVGQDPSTTAFQMGSPGSEPGRRADLETLHNVRLTKAWLIARTETSQEVWQGVARGLISQGVRLIGNPSAVKDGANPVEMVSWDDATAFCNALSLRLPTEAEWAFACRGGSDGPFAFGNEITTMQANFDGTKPWPGVSPGRRRGRPAAVGSLPPNAYGLHEMHGNVMEWCQDWFGRFTARQQTDPTGPTVDVVARVLRGGSWRDSADRVRSASRSGAGAVLRNNRVGFRAAASAIVQ